MQQKSKRLARSLKALIRHLITSLLCSCAYFFTFYSLGVPIQAACTFPRAHVDVFVRLMREQPADRFYYLHVNVSSAESTAAIHHQRFPLSSAGKCSSDASRC